ncbi:GNAT family N-acetyltransferase [Salinibaculum rarum]|uniref:GNAT family N-acetyltransferase n=1 Tax=Salinibaculum rarum TaxID=3058903 RepID=UPI00265DC29F|nr:GNAT family N-acetyltransferase [Salinibaculum sp. KK48]
MDDVSIEPARSDESGKLASLWVHLADSQREYGSHLRSDGNRQQIRETIVRHAVSNTLLVARDDDVIGFVMFTMETGGYQQDGARGIVENIFVEPSYRDRGVGERLLQAAEAELTQRGAETIALEVMAENQDARRFYRRQGYEPHRVELEKSVESDTHSKGDE